VGEFRQKIIILIKKLLFLRFIFMNDFEEDLPLKENLEVIKNAFIEQLEDINLSLILLTQNIETQIKKRGDEIISPKVFYNVKKGWDIEINLKEINEQDFQNLNEEEKRKSNYLETLIENYLEKLDLSRFFEMGVIYMFSLFETFFFLLHLSFENLVH
jgi:hypothetical protein